MSTKRKTVRELEVGDWIKVGRSVMGSELRQVAKCSKAKIHDDQGNAWSRRTGRPWGDSRAQLGGFHAPRIEHATHYDRYTIRCREVAGQVHDAAFRACESAKQLAMDPTSPDRRRLVLDRQKLVRARLRELQRVVDGDEFAKDEEGAA